MLDRLDRHVSIRGSTVLQYVQPILLLLLSVVLLNACSDDNSTDTSGGNVTQPGPATDTPPGNDPESLARKAVQAMFDRDELAYRDLVRPDYQMEVDLADPYRDYQGCSLDGVQTLAEQDDATHLTVTVLWNTPCGHSALNESPYTKCIVSLDQLSGRWYIRNTIGPPCD
jgi:hypothetical protein